MLNNKNLDNLKNNLYKILKKSINNLEIKFNEITVTINPENYLSSMKTLFKSKKTDFKVLIDICGIDYLNYKNNILKKNPRFAIILHLLSINKNWRLRIKVFIKNNDKPSIPSVTKIWKCANWYEREIYDLYGILFIGHKNIKRILTDYNFVGHPLRKDFPITGNFELKYNEKKHNIEYIKTNIKEHNIIPRVIK